LIRRRPGGAAKLNRENPALVCILNHLRTHGVPNGNDLSRIFKAPPYGWSPDTIRYLIAGLLQGGLIELKIGGNAHRTASPEAIQALSSSSGFRDVGVKLRENTPDIETYGRVRDRLAELTGANVLPIESSIAKETRTHVPQFLNQFSGLTERLESSQCKCSVRVKSLVNKLQQIVSTDGTEIIAEVGPVSSSTYDEWIWVRRVVKGFTSEVQKFLDDVCAIDELQWINGENEFEACRVTAKSFLEIVEQHRKDERADGAFVGLQAKITELPQFWAKLCQTCVQVYDSRLKAARHRLENHADWPKIDEELRHRLLKSLDSTCPSNTESNADSARRWFSCISGIDAKLNKLQGRT
jgi:hypothetical protein